MGILRSRAGGGQAIAEVIRETLFGDLPLDHWPADAAAADVYPWSAFAEARTHVSAGRTHDAKRCWKSVIGHAGLEPRHYLQAWHFLREHGEHPPDNVVKQVMGIVVEVCLPEGLDVLAHLPGGRSQTPPRNRQWHAV